MMSSMMNTNVFYSLPSHASLYDDQYDVKAGHWPKNKNECVLVLSKKVVSVILCCIHWV